MLVCTYHRGLCFPGQLCRDGQILAHFSLRSEPGRHCRLVRTLYSHATCQRRSSKRRDVCTCMRHDWQNTATTSHTQRRIAKGVYRCSSLHREACCRCLLRTTANAPSCCRTERSAQSRLRGSRSAIGSWTSARSKLQAAGSKSSSQYSML